MVFYPNKEINHQQDRTTFFFKVLYLPQRKHQSGVPGYSTHLHFCVMQFTSEHICKHAHKLSSPSNWRRASRSGPQTLWSPWVTHFRAGSRRTEILGIKLILLIEQLISTSILTVPGSLGVIQPFTGFPGGSDGKESTCNAGDLGSIPWRREWLPIPVFLPGESHGQRSLVDYSPWVSTSQTQLSD